MDVAKLFSFSGRISRRSFWFSVLVIIGYLVLVGILTTIHGLLGLAYLPVVWVGPATSVKRWHDRGKSGAWVLLGMIPIVGIWALIETGFLAGDPGDNVYGSPEDGSPFRG